MGAVFVRGGRRGGKLRVAAPGRVLRAASTSSGGGVIPENTSMLPKCRGSQIVCGCGWLDANGFLLARSDLGLPHDTPSLSSNSYFLARLHVVNDGAMVFGRATFFQMSSGITNSWFFSSVFVHSGMLRLFAVVTTQRFTFLL